LHSLDFSFGHRVRNLVERVAKGNCAGANDRPAALVIRKMRAARPGNGGGSLAPGMGDLDAGHCAMLFQKMGDACERFDVLFAPKPQATGRDTPFRRHRSGLDANESRPADRPGAKMDKMPVVGQALHRRILAQGRNADAIAQCYGAECERLK
jgi:hypothetical protein